MKILYSLLLKKKKPILGKFGIMKTRTTDASSAAKCVTSNIKTHMCKMIQATSLSSSGLLLSAWDGLPTTYQVRLSYSRQPDLQPCSTEAFPLQDAWFRSGTGDGSHTKCRQHRISQQHSPEIGKYVADSLGTLRPIYRTGVKLPSRCPILYLFNKYPYWIF